jgi:hypothetical protein
VVECEERERRIIEESRGLGFKGASGDSRQSTAHGLQLTALGKRLAAHPSRHAGLCHEPASAGGA